MAYAKLMTSIKPSMDGKAEEANTMWDPQPKGSSSMGSTAATAGDSNAGGTHWRELIR